MISINIGSPNKKTAARAEPCSSWEGCGYCAACEEAVEAAALSAAGTVPVLAIYRLRNTPMMRVATAIRIAFRIRCFFICLYSFERIYFAGLKLSRRVTTRLYTPGFLLSGVKKPVRTNWNFSPGLASFRLSSSLQPLRTTTLSGFR